MVPIFAVGGVLSLAVGMTVAPVVSVGVPFSYEVLVLAEFATTRSGTVFTTEGVNCLVCTGVIGTAFGGTGGRGGGVGLGAGAAAFTTLTTGFGAGGVYFGGDITTCDAAGGLAAGLIGAGFATAAGAARTESALPTTVSVKRVRMRDIVELLRQGHNWSLFYRQLFRAR